MIELSANEARALGVLIEKATTTPEQYPLSINALTNGSNQKNNRDPVLNLSEDDLFAAVEGLREKQLAVRVDAAGSRVHKFRHEADRVLGCNAAELAILAELLRGPQTLGELRGRASRMHPINTLDDAKAILTALMGRETPLVKEVAPAPGSRAGRYAQQLSPLSEQPTGIPAGAVAPSVTSSHVASSGLADRVAALEQEVVTLRAAMQKIAAAVGEPDPFAVVDEQKLAT
jgi:uncharacterized protein YceH (UPF0502 family)